MQKTVKTICPYCGVGCGLIAKVQDGRIVEIKGDKEHPSSHGALCNKGALLGEIVHTPNRLTTALSREHRAQEFQPLSLDAALDLVAGRFKEVIRKHGPDAVAFYVSGQLST